MEQQKSVLASDLRKLPLSEKKKLEIETLTKSLKEMETKIIALEKKLQEEKPKRGRGRGKK